MKEGTFSYIKLISFLLMTCFASPLASETFRTGKTSVINIESQTDFESSVKLGTNESLAIFLPEDRTFLEGIEIKMDIPEEIASWLDCIGCSIYDKVNPIPSPSQIDYSANRKYISTLPGRLSWLLQIPLKSQNSIKSSRYITKADVIPDSENGFVFLRLQPVMKGIPESTLNAKISMTVKPILSDKGLLELNLTGENAYFSKCIIYIDDEIISVPEDKKILLTSGIHNISVISEEFRDEVRTVRIDQTKTTALEIEMHSIEPTLIVNAPAGTKVFFDEEPYDSWPEELPVSEGDHKLKFIFGDYEITRNLTVIKGKTYTADLNVELVISEK